MLLLHVEPAEPLIQLPTPTQAQGSMAAFWAMRKGQKEETVANAAATTKTSTENVVVNNILPDIEEEEETCYIISFINLVQEPLSSLT